MPTSPLHLIESQPPQFSLAEACDIAREHYGLDVTATGLVSERDQNFLLRAADGGAWVLKIANAAEDPQVTDFQVQALLHISANSTALPVPAVRQTRSGSPTLRLQRQGASHIIRLVTWLPGKPFEPAAATPALCRNLGSFLARLGRSLHDFNHAGGQQVLLWDMRQALALREVLPLMPDAGERNLVASCLDEFAQHALPKFPALRSQVIHNDFNPDNILIDPAQPDEIAGVIDFGDLQRAPLIVDVAVGAAYLRRRDGDPLLHIADFVAGYHAVTALTRDEIGVLYDLLNTRLATTVALLAWRSGARDAGDSYLDKAAASEESAAPFLSRLRELGRRGVTRRLREVCASVSARPE